MARWFNETFFVRCTLTFLNWGKNLKLNFSMQTLWEAFSQERHFPKLQSNQSRQDILNFQSGPMLTWNWLTWNSRSRSPLFKLVDSLLFHRYPNRKNLVQAKHRFGLILHEQFRAACADNLQQQNLNWERISGSQKSNFNKSLNFKTRIERWTLTNMQESAALQMRGS